MSKKTFLTIIGVLFTCVIANSASANLVAWYQFEGNANDSSGNGYNASFQGGATTVNDSQRGQVLTLNGTTAYASCPTSFSSVTGTNHKTIMAWVKSNVASYSDVTRARIITLYRASDSSTGFSLTCEGNLSTYSSLYRTSNNYKWFDSGMNVAANAWVHVALVQNGTQVNYYINGILMNSANDGGIPYISNAVNATIGAYVYNSSGFDFFNGRIDDVRIYNNALSQQDIQAIIPEPASLILLALGGLLLRKKSAGNNL